MSTCSHDDPNRTCPDCPPPESSGAVTWHRDGSVVVTNAEGEIIFITTASGNS